MRGPFSQEQNTDSGKSGGKEAGGAHPDKNSSPQMSAHTSRASAQASRTQPEMTMGDRPRKMRFAAVCGSPAPPPRDRLAWPLCNHSPRPSVSKVGMTAQIQMLFLPSLCCMGFWSQALFLPGFESFPFSSVVSDQVLSEGSGRTCPLVLGMLCNEGAEWASLVSQGKLQR